MKGKKAKEEVAKLITEMTQLERAIAQQIHYKGQATSIELFSYFNTLNKLTSRLDKVWKGEVK